MREINLDDGLCREAMEILDSYIDRKNPSISSALANIAEAADEGAPHAVKNLATVVRFCAYLTQPKQVENGGEVN
jgi:hypothetical protein